MLVPNEIPATQNESKFEASLSLVENSPEDKKECDSTFKASRSIGSIALTTLPILNKSPNSNIMDLNISSTCLPFSYNITTGTMKNFNSPSSKNLTKYSTKSLFSNNNNFMASCINNFKKNVSYNTGRWPLAGENYPGFKPLGYRIRPTFGEQCLKNGNKLPSPREEPGTTLPYLDLFTEKPIERKISDLSKNDVIPKPVKPVSRLRKNRFPALFDSYNIRNGFLSFGRKSHSIIEKDQAIPWSTDFPGITSCNLNKVVHQEGVNVGLHDVSSEDCSECPLCKEEAALRARVSDVSMAKSKFPKYHVRLPTTD